jgi:F-type H+-transporting ATPase subunit gamma
MQLIEKQANEATGNKLDAYEMEASAERNDTLQDLAEFNLAAVSDLLLQSI